MYLSSDGNNLGSWIKKEIEIEKSIKIGQQGKAVKRVQEWLCYHDLQVVIDGDFGSVTKDAVQNYQDRNGLPHSGVVTIQTFKSLVEPMRSVLDNKLTSSTSLGNAIKIFAKAHLKFHPREFGGDNKGPWVRLYMKGREGPKTFWCAGFITFCMKQATEALGIDSPIRGSFSCDALAAQAKAAGLFLSERDAESLLIPPGSIFLVRKTRSDWTHTGIVTLSEQDTFKTIEGNTNDDGNRNGYEVCRRSRGYGKKDFIVFEN